MDRCPYHTLLIHCRYIRTKLLKLSEALLIAAITAVVGCISVFVMSECKPLAFDAPDKPIQVGSVELLIVVLSLSL